MSSPPKTRSRRHLESEHSIAKLFEIPDVPLGHPTPRKLVLEEKSMSEDAPTAAGNGKASENIPPCKSPRKRIRIQEQKLWSSLMDLMRAEQAQNDRVASLEAALAKSRKEVEKLDEEKAESRKRLEELKKENDELIEKGFGLGRN